MVRVFVSTDDPELFSLLEYILEAEGFPTRLIGQEDDVLFPDMAGGAVAIIDSTLNQLKLCRSITRRHGARSIAIIALVKHGKGSRVKTLLKAGATECITRPLKLSHLFACIRKASGDTKLRHYAPGIALDPFERTVSWQGRTARLSPIEFDLFLDLYVHHGEVRLRTDLLAAAGSLKPNLSQRSIDVHVCRLRRSLTPLGEHLIETIRSSGYKLHIPLR